MKFCSVDGCENAVSAKGLCPKHYYRNKRYGNPNLVRFPWREDRSCSIFNCTEEHEAKGYCKAHYMVIRKFGVSGDNLTKLILEQDELCAICNKKCSQGKRLSLDHDHDTGQIRGLLCASCNLALGGFNDSPDILKKALKYLEKWGKI